MTITSFEPLIITGDADAVIATSEALGFERRHKKTGINGKDVTSVTMKNADGFRVSVTQVDGRESDITSIRMNVRDYDEAYEFLTERGFVNAQGDHTNDSGTSKGTSMIAPSGFSIALSYHRRKGDPDRA